MARSHRAIICILLEFRIKPWNITVDYVKSPYLLQASHDYCFGAVTSRQKANEGAPEVLCSIVPRDTMVTHGVAIHYSLSESISTASILISRVHLQVIKTNRTQGSRLL